MSVRPALPEDVAAVAAIYAHYVRTSVATFELDPPDHDEWRRRRDGVIGAELPFLVVDCDGEVAGYAYCSAWKARPAYRGTVENSVYVAPWAVGRGLGTTLLSGLLDACRAANVREVIAVIAAGDGGVIASGEGEATASGEGEASVRLHRRCGFVDAGRLTRVGYKHDRLVDTVLMQWSASR